MEQSVLLITVTLFVYVLRIPVWVNIGDSLIAFFFSPGAKFSLIDEDSSNDIPSNFNEHYFNEEDRMAHTWPERILRSKSSE